MTSTRRRDRVGLWIAGLATAAGLWMGLAAPSVSPVTPSPTSTTVAVAPGPTS